MAPELLVRDLATCQHGLVTRRQALGRGVSRHEIDGRLRRGAWLGIHPGVYALAGSPDTRERRIMAACLAAGPEALASHRSAAWLWGLLPPAALVVEVMVPRGRTPSPAGVVVHRSRVATDRRSRQGIPVTSPLDALIGLAAVSGAETLHAALDRATRSRMMTGKELLDALDADRRPGRPGTRLLRSVLAQRGYPGLPSSVLERRMLALLRRFGLPEPVREHPAAGGGPTARYRLDFAWPPTPVMVEVDGFDTHGTPDALRADLARQNDLVALGYWPLRYTWRDLGDRPVAVAKDICRLLGRAGLELPPRLALWADLAS